jgi:hypothetical protein
MKSQLFVEKSKQSEKNPNLLNEEKQLNFFLKDLLEQKQNELYKTKTQLDNSKKIQTQMNSKLFEVQQQNIFLKDIRAILDSKVKALEKTSKPKSLKNTSKTYTDRMFVDSQMPLLAIDGTVKSLKHTLTQNFDKNWISNFKKLEDIVLLAKLQVEEIVDYTEKEALI